MLVDVPRVAHALDGVLGKYDGVGHGRALRVAAGPHHAAGGGVAPLVVQEMHARAERRIGREHERAAVLERGDDLGRVGAVGLGGLEVVVGDDGALLTGGALGDGFGADGGVDLFSNLRLGQGRGVIAVDLGNVHVPVIRGRDRDRLVAVVAVGRQVECFYVETS